ncbi:DUF4145 domain-containing protein [Kribbella steppae]|nr:DUF4145 domain-containing protein [Kribbella steppae]
MAKHLSKLDGWIEQPDWPRVACPSCGDGTLAPGTLVPACDVRSARLEAKRQRGGRPEELTGTFHGQLLCDNSSCGQIVSVAGDWQLIVNESGNPELGSFVENYRVRYANPPLRLLETPPATPATVRQGIESASSVLWASPGSAANRLRYAVEELLTAKKVRQNTMTRKKKRRRLSTGERLGLLEQSHHDVAKMLEAVKWIGNDGSHTEGLTASQVMEGAEILEMALKALYDRKDAELQKKIRAINRAKRLPRKQG